MSLDVSLYEIKTNHVCEKCGTPTTHQEEEEVFSANITHNLTTMANKAGIYEHLWRPEEIGITKASQLIEPLTLGLEKIKKRRKYFEKFNPSNGWGSYEGFVPWIEEYLEACKEYPEAIIRVSR